MIKGGLGENKEMMGEESKIMYKLYGTDGIRRCRLKEVATIIDIIYDF
jgi:hypothetical protein